MTRRMVLEPSKTCILCEEKIFAGDHVSLDDAFELHQLTRHGRSSRLPEQKPKGIPDRIPTLLPGQWKSTEVPKATLTIIADGVGLYGEQFLVDPATGSIYKRRKSWIGQEEWHRLITRKV